MDDNPDGFESDGLSRKSQNGEEFSLTTMTGSHSDEPRCGGTISHSVNGYISEHENDKQLKPAEESIQRDELNEKLSSVSRENGNQTYNQSKRTQDVSSLEQGKSRQHSIGIGTNVIHKDTYDEMDAIKEYTKHGDISTLAHESDHVDDVTIDILVDSLLKLKSFVGIKDGWTKKSIAKFLMPKLKKYSDSEESLKEICSLLVKGDLYDVFNHQPPTFTTVMPVSTGDKKFAATDPSSEKNLNDPLDQAGQMSQGRQVMSEHPNSQCSENHDYSSSDDHLNQESQALQGSSGVDSGNQFVSFNHLNQSDPSTYQNSLDDQVAFNSNPYHFNHHSFQCETFKFCGAVGEVGESCPQLPLSQDETRRQRHPRVDHFNHRRLENMYTPTTGQTRTRKQNDTFFYLTNQQYQLSVKIEGQSVVIKVTLKSTNASCDKQHARELAFNDHINYWKYQLTQLGIHPKTHAFNDAPVIVAYSSVPALVDGLTALGFDMTGEADIDPVALHQLQQQENLIEMVFLTVDQDSEPLAMLSQSDPGSFDDPRNCPMQFVSQLGNTCGMDNFVPPLYKKDKAKSDPVEPTDAADSSMKSPLDGCFLPELAYRTIEDTETFRVDGAVQANQEDTIQDDIYQVPRPCSQPLKQYCMQPVPGTICQLPACMVKETGASVITGILPILPQIESTGKQLGEKCSSTTLPEPDSVICKQDNLKSGEKISLQDFNSGTCICFHLASHYDTQIVKSNSK